MSRGILFSQMHPPTAEEADFHDWYQTEHIPARLAVPGFSHAIRYEQHEGEPRFLAVYYLKDMAALETPAYRALKEQPSERTERMLANVSGFTRYIADEISDTGAVDPQAARVLFAVAFEVPDSDVDDFDDWYQGEHIPLLMKVPGWLRVRRYRTRPGAAGRPWTHFALHELADVSALDAPERAAARDTAKRDALASREWFDSGRWNYFPIHFDAAKEQN